MTISLLSGGRRLIWIAFLLVGLLAACERLGFISFPFARFLTSPLILEFVAGCLIAAYVEQREIRWPWFWFLFAAIWFVSVAVWMILSDYALASGRVRELRVALLLPPSAAIVASAVGLERRQRPPRLLTDLGDASFSLYLWHLPVFDLIRRALIHPAKLPPVAAEFVWLAAICLACWLSLLSYRFVEKPVLGWLTRAPARMRATSRA